MSTSSVAELLVPGPALALAGLLDLPTASIDDGWALPDLWHWVYLLERPAQALLGPEGHPARGIPQPPRPGLRRMFAGGRVTTHHRLVLGRAASRRTEVAGTRTRSGRSGELTIVTTRSTVEQGGRIALVDEQDIIYREPGPLAVRTTPAGEAATPEHAGPEHEFVVEPDPAYLFRFSALTYNAHRIHYDLRWCRDEDYADLVVHGPLQALLMAQAAERLVPTPDRSTEPTQFAYRLVAPLVLGQGMRVGARRDGDAVATTVRDSSGRLTAVASRGAPPPNPQVRPEAQP